MTEGEFRNFQIVDLKSYNFALDMRNQMTGPSSAKCHGVTV